MAYLGEYTEVGWQNEPSRATPINAHNLGIMEDGIKRLFYYLLAGGGTGGGSGTDGREVELRNNGEYIQWKYSGDEEWVNLVPLSDLKGEKGDDYVLTEEDILKIAEKVKIDVPDSAADISFENEGTNLESTDVQGAISELSGQNVDRANALWAIMQKTAFTEQLTDAELTAFKTAWGITDSEEEPEIPPVEPDEPEQPEITLSSITATYTGGDVTVGTAVSSLTGITVKATYSDGSTKNVTGYTLSGTIVEGSNTITVSYQGKTTTFTVTGVAESGGDTDIHDGYVSDGLEVRLDAIRNTIDGHDSSIKKVWNDVSGNDYAVTVASSCEFVTHDTYIDANVRAQAKIASTDLIAKMVDGFTIEVVFQPKSVTDDTVVFNVGVSKENSLINTQGQFRLRGSTTLYGTAMTNKNAIRHYTYVYNGTSVKMYHDGVIDVEQTGTMDISTQTFVEFWGVIDWANVFKGTLNAGRIYSRALTEEEVVANYNNDIARFGTMNEEVA